MGAPNLTPVWAKGARIVTKQLEGVIIAYPGFASDLGGMHQMRSIPAGTPASEPMTLTVTFGARGVSPHRFPECVAD